MSDALAPVQLAPAAQKRRAPRPTAVAVAIGPAPVAVVDDVALVERVRDLLALTKPRITAMAVIVAAGALLLAPGTIDVARALLALLGIALAVAGAGALNMWLERDVDLLMERTRARPLPSGRMSPAVALVVGGALSAASLPLLWSYAGALSTALTAFSLFVYVLVYTPMKRTSPWALVVGAVPGAMPALMGSSAVSGTFDVVGTALFFVVFLWQLPHFLAISIYRRDEYIAAGHQIVPLTHGMRAAKALLLGTALLVAASGVALWALDVASVKVGAVAAALGAWFVIVCLRGMLDASYAEDARWARKVFFATLIYQTVLFGALAVDAVLS